MKKFILAIVAIFFVITSGHAQQMSPDIIPSQGFSMSSLFRGTLGMLVLLAISILLSKNIFLKTLP